MFSNRYRYGFIALLAGYSFLNVLYMEALEYYGLHAHRAYVLLLFGLMILFIWEGNRLVEIRLDQLQQWLGKRVHPLIISFGCSLVVTLLAVIVPALVIGKFVLQLPKKELDLGLKLSLAVGFRVNLFLNTINIIYFFMRQLRETQVEAEKLKKISLQARFQSLKDQVNPHFLFNNLNVLSTLVFKDQEMANEFIQQLSRVYRYVLQNQDKELIEVGEELAFIESYVYLLHTRFGENLTVCVDVPLPVRNYYTIPMAVQMLVENAIKHNVSSKSRPLKIDLFADEEGFLVVRNNLQRRTDLADPLPPEHSTRIGLQNITKRYGFVSNKMVSVVADEKTFTVKLPLIQLAES
jgi:two-component system, LytTR family, sensor kinase